MLIVDENLTYKIALQLKYDFPGVTSVFKAKGLGEMTPDTKVWAYAKQNRLAILTKDKDFPDMLLRLGQPPKIIRIIGNNLSKNRMIQIVKVNKVKIEQFLSAKNNGLLELQ